MKNTIKTLMILGTMLQGTAVLSVCDKAKENTAYNVYTSCIEGCKNKAHTDQLRMDCINSSCDPIWKKSMEAAGCPIGAEQLNKAKELVNSHK